MYRPATRAAGAIAAASMQSAELSGLRSSSGKTQRSSGCTACASHGSAALLVLLKKLVASAVLTTPARRRARHHAGNSRRDDARSERQG